MGYRVRKVDTNQPDIVAAFRAMGVSVWITSTAGQGAPDLAVGEADWMAAVEVKTEKGKLTEDQERWLQTWKGPYYIVRSPQEAHQLVADQRMKVALSRGQCGGCSCRGSCGRCSCGQ